MECIPASKAAFYSSLLFFIDGLVFVWSPILLLFIQSTYSLVYIAFFMCIISMVMLIRLRPQETVKFLLSKGRYKEAIIEAERVGRYNGKSESEIRKV